MGYDLHIGDSIKNHSFKYEMNDCIHHELFEIIKANKLNLGLLEKMIDYYADSKIHHSEIIKFIEQLNIVLEYVKPTSSLYETITRINEITAYETKNNKTLFWFLD